MANETILLLTGMGVTPYSARGLEEELEIDPSALAPARRTVNGTLVDVSSSQLRKYRSIITGSDQDPPAFDSQWPGTQLTVDCISELAYLTSGGSPGRTVVPGTSRVDGLFTFYRPRLTMMVEKFSWLTREYEARVGWTLELREV